ncbi:topoisomerase IV [Agaribacter flavus]|uniref:Topoisomerase IV n=1 Tax=Agaribacter flavus TaxID=1902781 RepID=A0ABV7FLK6_9ALTE
MKKILLSAAIAASFYSPSSLADIRINGFANLVGGYSNTDADPDIYGFSDSVDFSNQSLFAVQLSGDVNEKVSATAQIISRGSNDFDTSFEWAYLTYSLSDNTEISAGRLRLPLFLYSESLDVGYSYHWITAPQTVYGILFNNLDGLRVRHTGYSAGIDYEFQGAYGVIENKGIDVGGNGDIVADLKGTDTVLFSAQAAYESYKLRAVYGRSTVSLPFESLSQAVASFNQFDPVLADLFDFNEDTGVFYGFSLGFDNFDYFASAEYTVAEVADSNTPKDTNYYVTTGGRFGKYTPSVTYERRDGAGEIKFLDRVAALPAPLQPTVAATVSAFQIAQFDDFSILSVGLRYDVDSQIALKGEVIQYNDRLNDELDGEIFRVAASYVF